MCFINAAQGDDSQNHRGYSRYINNPYMQPMGFPFNAPKSIYPENENIENVDYDVNQISEGFPFEFIQALQQKNQSYPLPQTTAQQQYQYYQQEQQPAQQQQQQQYFSYQPQFQQPQQQYQQVETIPYYAEKPSFAVPLSAQVPENEIYQVIGHLEADSQEDEESSYQNENNKFYFSQFQPSVGHQLEKYEDNDIQQGYPMPVAYTEQSQQQPQIAQYFNEPSVYQYAPYPTIPANIPMVAASEINNNNNNNINFVSQCVDYNNPEVYAATSGYYDAQIDGLVKYENCSETADCMVSNNHRMEPNSPSNNELSQATNIQEDQKQEIVSIQQDNEEEEEEEEEEHDPNEPEILGRIRSSNKKNVVKNIMSAFKRFIQELDSENNEKLNDSHSAAVASKIQNLKQNHISASEGFHIDVPVERENVLSLYNESKVKPDSIEEMSKKFKRYIASKQFNHYTIRLLVQHANYGSIFKYFLENHAQNWLNQSKVDDPNGHKVMIEFLQAAYEDIGIIEKLKKHEKRKAIYH